MAASPTQRLQSEPTHALSGLTDWPGLAKLAEVVGPTAAFLIYVTGTFSLTVITLTWLALRAEKFRIREARKARESKQAFIERMLAAKLAAMNPPPIPPKPTNPKGSQGKRGMTSKERRRT